MACFTQMNILDATYWAFNVVQFILIQWIDQTVPMLSTVGNTMINKTCSLPAKRLLYI